MRMMVMMAVGLAMAAPAAQGQEAASPEKVIPNALPAPPRQSTRVFEPRGARPDLGLIEGIDADGVVKLRNLGGHRLMPTSSFANGGKGLPPNTSVLIPAIDEWLIPLKELQVYDRSGQKVTDLDALRKRFAQPCVVARSPSYIDKGVDPSYLKALAPDVLFIAQPWGKRVPNIHSEPPPVPEYLKQAEMPALAEGGTAPYFYVTRGLDPEGRLLFEFRQYSPTYKVETREVPVTEIKQGKPVTITESVQATVYDQTPQLRNVIIPEPLEGCRAFDNKGRPISPERLRKLLSKPAIVLSSTSELPVDPVYLKAVGPNVPLLYFDRMRYTWPPPAADPLASQPVAPTFPQPAILEGDVKADGLLGFPQKEAVVLSDKPDLRLSAWNDAKWLYLQAVLWNDDSNHVGPAPASWRLRQADKSTFLIDPVVAEDANAGPHDVKFTWNLGKDSPYKSGDVGYGYDDKTKGYRPIPGVSRSAIRYARTPDGKRVRVDSLLIPLETLKLKPGDKVRLSVNALSTVPPLLLSSSAGQQLDQQPEYTIADRPAGFDEALMPDGSKDPALLSYQGPSMVPSKAINPIGVPQPPSASAPGVPQAPSLSVPAAGVPVAPAPSAPAAPAPVPIAAPSAGGR